MGYNKSALQFGTIAEVNSGHALIMPQIDPVIKSVLNKEANVIYKRMKTKMETVENFRWVEESALNKTAAFINPRTITSTANPGITRVEKMARLKGMSNRITYGLFDRELQKNAALFSQVLEDDMSAMLTDMIQLKGTAIWTGTDTSYSSPTTDQYFGLMTAITNTGTIPVKTATTPTIAQGIKTQVAKMCSNPLVRVKPTAIYMNPLTVDAMEIEENAQTDKQKQYTLEVVPGTIVTAIMTVAGLLPIIPDDTITIDTAGATTDVHPIVIVDESKIVRHYLAGYADPVVFKLGLVDTLIDDYVAVTFDNVVVEFPDKAHCIMKKSFTK
jgi:hypothetical protein